MFNFVATFILGQLRDKVLDIVENVLPDEQHKKLARSLRSDAVFQAAFDKAMQRAAQRFADHYSDKDVVAAIVQNGRFWEAPGVRTALREVISHPSSYLEPQHVVLSGIFADLALHIAPERLDKAMAYFLYCLADEVISIPQLAPIYQTQFAKASLQVQHRQLALQEESNQLQAQNNQSFGALLEAGQTRAALLAPGTPPLPKVYHNLPRPDYDAFVGREAEFKKVIERLSPTKREGVITIDGIGGVGKSALALAVAYHFLYNFDTLPEAERYSAIIWTSAKQTVLTADGIRTRSQVLRNLEDIYTAIAITLGREDITRAKPEEQAALVIVALAERRTLLIVDNLETVDDENLLEFLRELPMSAKAIVTTRHRIDVAYPVRLTGMPEQDALTLIQNESVRKGVKLTADEAKRLFVRTGGLPLAMVWSIGLAARGLPVETVLAKLGSAKSDIVKFCFEASVAALSPDAYKLLLALSLFAKDATREALGYVADFGDDILSRDEGLAELERMSLVNKAGEHFSLHLITKTFAAHALSQRSNKSAIVNSWVSYCKYTYDSRSVVYKDLAVLIVETTNIFGFFEWCLANERVSDFTRVFLQVTRLLWSRGYWTAFHHYLSVAYEYTLLNNPNGREMAILEYEMGSNLYFKGELEDAAFHFSQALPMFLKLKDARYATRCYRYIALIYARLKDVAQAKSFIEMAYRVAESPESSKDIIYTLKRYDAEVKILSGDLSRAKRLLEENIEYYNPDNEDSSTVTMAHALLGQINIVQKDFVTATLELRKARELVQVSQVKPDFAFITYCFALLEEALGHKDEALEYASAALQQCKSLGMMIRIPTIEELIGRLSS